MVVATSTPPRISALDILRDSGPRLVRDSLGPVGAFYAGYRLKGLVLGVVLATSTGILLFLMERRHGRSGLLARLSLGFVLVQAAVGLISRSATLYFMQPVILDLVLAAIFLGSTVFRHPLIGATARDAYPFPPEVAESATFGRIFGRVSLMWGGYFLVRATVRLLAVSTGNIETILVVNVFSDAPPVIALLVFSVWYSVHGFRTSAEWGPLISLVEQATPAVIPDES